MDLTENLSAEPESACCCLHVEGFHYARVTNSLERYRKAGWKLSLHTPGLPIEARTPEAFAQLLQRFDLVFVNDEIIREIYGFGAPISTLLGQVKSALSSVPGRADVVLTLGELGAVVFRKNNALIEVPALPVDRVDATGAGDAFAGVFLSLWLHGASLSDSARHAAIAGSLTTTALGAQSHIATLAEIQSLLSSVSVRDAG